MRAIEKKARRGAPENGHMPLAGCGCETAGGGRKAVAVDPAIKEANRHRLSRIEGQIRGLQKMVEEDRYCADIIVQVASVQEALRGVARNLMKNHLRHCAAKALESGRNSRPKRCTTSCSN